MKSRETCDIDVVIEDEHYGYIRYRNVRTGEVWVVLGICVNLGYCYKGATNPKPWKDCPVACGFEGCCSLQTIKIEDGN